MSRRIERSQTLIDFINGINQDNWADLFRRYPISEIRRACLDFANNHNKWLGLTDPASRSQKTLESLITDLFALNQADGLPRDVSDNLLRLISLLFHARSPVRHLPGELHSINFVLTLMDPLINRKTWNGRRPWESFVINVRKILIERISVHWGYTKCIDVSFRYPVPLTEIPELWTFILAPLDAVSEEDFKDAKSRGHLPTVQWEEQHLAEICRLHRHFCQHYFRTERWLSFFMDHPDRGTEVAAAWRRLEELTIGGHINLTDEHHQPAFRQYVSALCRDIYERIDQPKLI